MRSTAIALFLLTVPALAVTPVRSTPALQEAVRTGEILGGAAACGAPEDRVVALGRKIAQRLASTAESPEDLKRAQTFHEEARRRGSERIRAGEGNCGEALSSFRALEAGYP